MIRKNSSANNYTVICSEKTGETHEIQLKDSEGSPGPATL
jgi:hypothetical protein